MEQYEREKKVYYEKKAQYKVHITVRSKGLRRLTAIFKASCTPADVAAEFRRRNYPRSGWKFFEIREAASSRFLDPSTSLINLSVMSGALLDIKFQEVQTGSMAPIAERNGEDAVWGVDWYY